MKLFFLLLLSLEILSAQISSFPPGGSQSGGASPAGSLCAPQTYLTAGSFNGDATKFCFIYSSVAAPPQPGVITHGGTPGTNVYDYSLIGLTAIGHTGAGTVRETTTGATTLSMTNTNVVPYVCSAVLYVNCMLFRTNITVAGFKQIAIVTGTGSYTDVGTNLMVNNIDPTTFTNTTQGLLAAQNLSVPGILNVGGTVYSATEENVAAAYFVGPVDYANTTTVARGDGYAGTEWCGAYLPTGQTRGPIVLTGCFDFQEITEGDSTTRMYELYMPSTQAGGHSFRLMTGNDDGDTAIGAASTDTGNTPVTVSGTLIAKGNGSVIIPALTGSKLPLCETNGVITAGTNTAGVLACP